MNIETQPKFELDATDRALLEALQIDADRSNLALAQAVGLSPATCLRRVQRLKSQGVIERISAVLHPQAMGGSITAVVEIGLERQTAEGMDAFAELALQQAEVQQCYRVAPGPDFVLVVLVRDMTAYHAFSQRLLRTDANVRSAKAYFAVQRHRFGTEVPLPPASR